MSELERLRQVLDLIMQFDEHIDFMDFFDGSTDEMRRLTNRLRRDVATRLHRLETDAMRKQQRLEAGR